MIIIGLFLYCLASQGWGLYLFISSGSLNIWLFFTVAFVVLLLVGFVWPMEYTLLEDELLVRYGNIRSRYKYDIITGIKPSHNPLSSPELSLNRVKISYK